jgi:tetratricopeptide (TPR) repeat protein
MLEPLYEASGNWPALVSVLQIQREAKDGLSAGRAPTRIAEVQENKLQSRQAALGTWKQILDVDPYSTRALSEFERPGHRARALHRAGRALPELAEKRDTGDVSGPADLLGRAARLYMARFSDRASAIRVWRQVLDLDSTNVQTAAPAADALEALYIETGDFRGLVDVLRAKVEWTGDRCSGRRCSCASPPWKRSRWATCRRRSRPTRPCSRPTATTARRSTTSSASSRGPGSTASASTSSTAGWGPAIRRPPRAALPHRRHPRARAQRRPTRPSRPCWPSSDESADDRTALDALARLYDKKGATAERLEILERRLALGHQPRGSRWICCGQIAEILQGPLGRPGEAFDRWREILQLLAPRSLGAGQLERLWARTENALRILAAQALEPIYESADRVGQAGPGPRTSI